MDISELKSKWHVEVESDQQKGAEIPPFAKGPADGATLIDLPAADFLAFRGTDLVDAIVQRRSVRKFAAGDLTIAELGWLLFATQGVQKATPRGALRTSPSAGARHPFETYVVALEVEGLAAGIYRYLAYDHKLESVRQPDSAAGAGIGTALPQTPGTPDGVSPYAVTAVEALRDRAQTAINGQGWGAPAMFFWTAVPYRTHWRYPLRMPKLVLLDAGHLCQNLYLACAAVGCGTCAVGAYDQELCDTLLGVDGQNELTVYVAPVGRV